VVGNEFTQARQARLVRYTKVRVQVTHGPDAGAHIELAGNAARVGTAPDNDLVLTDNSVSRRHCEIEPTQNGIRVRDAGSTNGVFIGEHRLFDAVITVGTPLRLGDTVLSVSALGETIDREQALSSRFGDLLGGSGRMRELFADLQRIAEADVSVLIEGETGTGKELVAESVHQASARADGPFVVFDCSAVAPTLAESELFGHERGAFTGAVGSRPGVFEQAHGGTIFLDELGELPRDLQPKLLRVLEKREVRRLGAQRTLSVDVRVIAATNRNLPAEVQRGNFREDLYFRVAAAHVHVPPLRDRMDDLPLLVDHFLRLQNPPRSMQDVSPPVWDMFRSHRWPGNVRELHNAVQRLIVTPDRALHPSQPPPASSSALGQGAPVAPGETVPLRVARRDAADAFEQRYLQGVLAKTGGNVTRAAAIAEVSRQMIQKLMRKHGIG
jgi:transcriptional regulator with GAF, ATPase, and Fis domain